jgi:DNA-binding transcriptional MerR regulator
MANSDYQTIGAVAAQLGLPRWQLAYLIEHGDVPGPSLQVPGRRLFSAQDVVAIRKALEGRTAAARATLRMKS